MYNRKELQESLLKSLSVAVEKYGFAGKLREQSFYAAKPFGWGAFHLAFIPHSTDFDVTTDVALRIAAVEDLVSQSRESLSKKEKKQTATMGCELGNLSEGKQKRWTVAKESDVKKAAVEIETALKTIAIPYIEHYSDLQQAFAVLSGNERTSWLHSPFHSERCQRALALAFVLKKYKQIDELTSSYEEYLKSRNDFGLREFQQLASNVRSLVAAAQRTPSS